MSWQEIKNDLNYGLAAFGIQLPERIPLDEWAGRLAGNPAQNTVALVSAASVIFYAAERQHNPKVNDLWDAIVYCSTCISVGYADIVAATPVGKAVGSLLMMIGPAMAGRFTDGPATDRRDKVQEEILNTMQQILKQMPRAALDQAR
jgi:hypothetical protein